MSTPEEETRRKIPVRTETWERQQNISGVIHTRQAIIEVGPQETLTVAYELFADMLGQLGMVKKETTYPPRKDPNS